jgi:hypothetical protein
LGKELHIDCSKPSIEDSQEFGPTSH